jgi:hypothetical protein
MNIISRDHCRALIRGKLDMAKYAHYRAAVMGKYNGGTSWTFTVPGGRGYTYVRLMQNGKVATLTQALNKASVPNTGNLPIWVDRDIDGRLIIVATRFEG